MVIYPDVVIIAWEDVGENRAPPQHELGLNGLIELIDYIFL